MTIVTKNQPPRDPTAAPSVPGARFAAVRRRAIQFGLVQRIFVSQANLLRARRGWAQVYSRGFGPSPASTRCWPMSQPQRKRKSSDGSQLAKVKKEKVDKKDGDLVPFDAMFHKDVQIFQKWLKLGTRPTSVAMRLPRSETNQRHGSIEQYFLDTYNTKAGAYIEFKNSIFYSPCSRRKRWSSCSSWTRRFLRRQRCRALSYFSAWGARFRQYSSPAVLQTEAAAAFLRPWHLVWEAQMGCKGLVEPAPCKLYKTNRRSSKFLRTHTGTCAF